MGSNATSVLCDACARLGTLIQGSEPHSALLNRGSRAQAANNSIEEMFRCADCNTIWVRHIDKWGLKGMFRLVSNVSAPD